MTTMRQHPSVLFQKGEVKDFDTAMDTYVAQYREELRQSREILRNYPPETEEERAKWRKEDEEQARGVEHIEAMVSKARTIYHEMVDDACKRAAEIMRIEGDHTLREIADAVESGNWSDLAV